MHAGSTIPAPRAARPRRLGRLASAVLLLGLVVPGVASAQVVAGPTSDRATDRRGAHERVETFEVGDIGAVTLAWNASHVRVVEVRTAPDWRSHVRQATRRSVRVGFTNGRACAVFVAGLREDGLHTAARRVDCDPDRPDTRPDARPDDSANADRAAA